MWNFEQIIAYGQRYSGPAGTELAFVLSEWDAEDGLGLLSAYPAVHADEPPVEDAPESVANRLWAKINNGAWQQVSNMASVTNVGVGRVGVLQSGLVAGVVVKPWPTKGIAAGYVIGTGASIAAINNDRTTGVAITRTYVNSDETDHPLHPDEPFTAGQTGILSTWLNDHGITNAEFAALFGVVPTELSDWLQTNARKEFVSIVCDKFE